jgi:hypothetical protein
MDYLYQDFAIKHVRKSQEHIVIDMLSRNRRMFSKALLLIIYSFFSILQINR